MKTTISNQHAGLINNNAQKINKLTDTESRSMVSGKDQNLKADVLASIRSKNSSVRFLKDQIQVTQTPLGQLKTTRTYLEKLKEVATDILSTIRQSAAANPEQIAILESTGTAQMKSFNNLLDNAQFDNKHLLKGGDLEISVRVGDAKGQTFSTKVSEIEEMKLVELDADTNKGIYSMAVLKALLLTDAAHADTHTETATLAGNGGTPANLALFKLKTTDAFNTSVNGIQELGFSEKEAKKMTLQAMITGETRANQVADAATVTAREAHIDSLVAGDQELTDFLALRRGALRGHADATNTADGSREVIAEHALGLSHATVAGNMGNAAHAATEAHAQALAGHIDPSDAQKVIDASIELQLELGQGIKLANPKERELAEDKIKEFLKSISVSLNEAQISIESVENIVSVMHDNKTFTQEVVDGMSKTDIMQASEALTELIKQLNMALGVKMAGDKHSKEAIDAAKQSIVAA